MFHMELKDLDERLRWLKSNEKVYLADGGFGPDILHDQKLVPANLLLTLFESRAVILKYLKDGLIIKSPGHLDDCYLISVEGLFFINQDGYEGQHLRNQLSQNRVNALDKIAVNGYRIQFSIAVAVGIAALYYIYLFGNDMGWWKI